MNFTRPHFLSYLFIFAIRDIYKVYYETNIISKEDFTMKKMLVLGMTLVVLLVGIAVVNANSNNNAETTTPDDETLIKFYLEYKYGSDCQATLLDYLSDDEYVGYEYCDPDSGHLWLCSVRRSYAMQIYERNN